MKDKGVFAVPAVALLIGIGSLVTLDDGMTGVESFMHVAIGVLGLAMAAASTAFAMRWNAPAPPRPAAKPAAAATGDHLHSTFGTSGVGGDMAVGPLGGDGSTGTAFDTGAGSGVGDAGGADSGGSDTGGGSFS
jgi:hypothetical protein